MDGMQNGADSGNVTKIIGRLSLIGAALSEGVRALMGIAPYQAVPLNGIPMMSFLIGIGIGANGISTMRKDAKASQVPVDFNPSILSSGARRLFWGIVLTIVSVHSLGPVTAPVSDAIDLYRGRRVAERKIDGEQAAGFSGSAMPAANTAVAQAIPDGAEKRKQDDKDKKRGPAPFTPLPVIGEKERLMMALSRKQGHNGNGWHGRDGFEQRRMPVERRGLHA